MIIDLDEDEIETLVLAMKQHFDDIRDTPETHMADMVLLRSILTKIVAQAERSRR